MIKRLNQQLTIERTNKHKINSIKRQIDPNVQILQFKRPNISTKASSMGAYHTIDLGKDKYVLNREKQEEIAYDANSRRYKKG